MALNGRLDQTGNNIHEMQMTYGDVGMDERRFLAVFADEAASELVEWRRDDLEKTMITRKQRLQEPSVFLEPSEAGHRCRPTEREKNTNDFSTQIRRAAATPR